MPKRTNIFQRLVKLLHDRLDKNWEVNESEMLCNRLTGKDREVDIVLKYRLGTHKLIVSIECTDTERPASSTWVEAMAKSMNFYLHQSLFYGQQVVFSNLPSLQLKNLG